MYKIEKNIPIPRKIKPEIQALYDAANKMEVGDSIVIPRQKTQYLTSGFKIKGKFLCRSIGNDQSRCWKTEE